MPRPPNWIIDEWLLALDFYLKHKDRLPSKNSQEIKALSVRLRALRSSFADLPANFRNPAGVAMQVSQFAALDPTHNWKGMRVSKGARQVWEAHKGDLAQVPKIVKKIDSFTQADFSVPSAESIGVCEAVEGQILTYWHVRRERSTRLTRRKKEQFQDENKGRLFCEICRFDYARRYGEHGEGFIEAHHTRPLSQLPNEGATIKLADLILLCANCHRMIHRKTPWLTPDELRQIIRV
ncbi:MAG: HNH endonuclease [Alphaproteobacteria bacterium]|nr:HNH endonuclease [Alphaproteobacteria bacterium]